MKSTETNLLNHRFSNPWKQRQMAVCGGFKIAFHCLIFDHFYKACVAMFFPLILQKSDPMVGNLNWSLFMAWRYFRRINR